MTYVCQLQIFVLQEIFNQYKNKDVVVVSIDVWIVLGETVDTLNSLINAYRNLENPYPLDWTFGVDDSTGTLYNKYATEGVPMLYMLDKNGNIYYQKPGYTEYSVLSEKLNELLE